MSLQEVIEKAWDNEDVNLLVLKEALQDLIFLLNEGKLRAAYKEGEAWKTNAWIKKGILLFFKLKPCKLTVGPTPSASWFDKIGLKFEGWKEEAFAKAQIRAVPGAVIRKPAYIGPNVVIMPSFINVGAYVGSGSLIDTWATIGSCAQIGKNCHISGGVGIGGVLEPLQANPVIIEDNCFIGARCEIAEGVIIKEGAVLAMGLYIGASTKIINRETNAITHGIIPAYSVVVPGSYLTKNNLSLNCAVIVKKVDEKTRSKTSINELLRF